MRKVLTIAGSDSCGGAGIQADLKTFAALGTYGMSVITAVTAQNTQGVFAVQEIAPEMVAKQISCLYEDIVIDAVKIGMVSKTEIIKTIARKLKEYQAKNIVVDPVMISKSGYDLMHPEAKEELIRTLLPVADVVTPNLYEAQVILEREITTVEDMEKAARDIVALGPKSALVKGGHLRGNAVDVLYDGESFTYYDQERIATTNTHGTGCTYSSAIAAHLARGLSLKEAVQGAKEYITGAILNSFSIGKGVGPTHHFYKYY
ncbi:bifunctional hydroxymethylpyrimidine kinase/phosphomethylpyrimidine kinase [Thermanaerosceptrum fracticalcis]|uniref:Hydroxymethylpyrimidine/phosphomethylpyrimidine kinase n=1 Tax=Thermanaerosceptrum fracticalcis TaxID=1712410 RepID=A0A7G6E7T8_THEFR|nr:bifunctional hydroxymethylpyrimidine kinase/phosphomethylpyrimidine kinase [Thermanaerosceptrum fracticalcis]QNB48142.1 bifunctional hydroxymethylpyrimidine kinase/phosphomethylpyrimidine kinase [Thermanaerosceptrum fracticalcis]